MGGHEAVARLLLDAALGAAMRADRYGSWPLHYATSDGADTVARLLLQAAPQAAMAAGTAGWLPLHYAAGHMHEGASNGNVVRLLLQAAPQAAMIAERCDNRLPLHLAAMEGQEVVTRLLLEAAPAASTARTKRNFLHSTPLELALSFEHPATARVLLGAGPPELVLAALAAHNPDHSLFADCLLAPGRMPLEAAHWALVPSPCIGIGRALPTALACSPAQAALLVRHLPAADAARLRTAALCLGRSSLPGALAGHILARLFC
ncbi:hypothetical protein COHA_002248 [Chlorella ohadii]|uniref:Uncharacterized protein n=1 Tax=Chlorella ohadii TaxID=2649997 RepID=A0AAD5E0P3_9CHLO|nr:hypothetical protein COHA_002248 [Chlorella ohadii]